MTPPRWKSLSLRMLYICMALGFLSPLYMYLSFNVEKLKKEFPHPKINKDMVSFDVKAGKPGSWTRLNQVSRYGKWAIVLSEDWSFYQHSGFDLEQIRVAVTEMIQGNRFRGASTITQQMVKNVYLTEDRTLWRKLHEFILAQKVERILPKDRILEIYLNVIEFGPGIIGIGEASRHYFKKPPSELTPKESAFLAMLLPSPKRYYVSFKKKKLTKFASDRVDAILVKLRMGKVLTFAQYEVERRGKLSWEK